MKNKFFYLAVSVLSFASAIAQNDNGTQTACADFCVPYGNLGLDFAAAEIDSANSALFDASGLKFFYGYYGVVVGNPYGGNAQGTNYTHEMVYGVKANLDKLAGWKGGEFVVSGAYDAGDNLSNKIGNFFISSESYISHGGALFYELYLAQTFETSWGDAVRICMGRISMSDAFKGLPAFSQLVSGGIDSTPQAIFANSPFTSSPTAGWGASAKYSTVSDLSFSAGLYQATPAMSSPNWHGTDFGISDNDGYMTMFQASWNPVFYRDDNGGYAGVYRLAGYFFGGYDMPDFTSNTGGVRSNGYGFYLEGQQTVWVDSADKNRNVSVWAGAQYSPVNSISTISWMTYAGVQLQGFVPHRSKDAILFSWMTGWFGSAFSNDYCPSARGYVATYETLVEATYVYQINEHIAIQPDIQYIMRPYGNSDADDALVIGGQIVATF